MHAGRPAAAASLPPADAALVELLQRLADADYRFVAPGPNTYRRLGLRRGGREASNLQDIFGWNLPFTPGAIPERWADLAQAGGMLRRRGARCETRLAVASVGELLFLHSTIPARNSEHVFLGPDSYRFHDFILSHATTIPPGARILDLGCGAGVGGVTAARTFRDARLTLSDVNPKALQMARVNAAAAGEACQLLQCDGAPTAGGPFDLIIANAPYIRGSGLTYSDGGSALGAETTLAWARSSLEVLAPGGRLLLYSGSAIVRGEDRLQPALRRLADAAGVSFGYRELDADVFPATLLNPGYWGVERIAAVGAVLGKPN